MLTVWIPERFQPNHSTTSISMVPGIFIVLFRLICWESQAFLPVKKNVAYRAPVKSTVS